MTFADKYSKHAYADLIREAETQGIGLGVQAERKRIIALLEANVCNIYGEFCAPEDVCMSREALISLIGGEGK